MAKVTRINQAVILAGGRGTRLRPLTDDKPKPMVLVNNRPFLEYLMDQLRWNGIREIVLLLGYLPEKVMDHFGDGSKFGVQVRYSVSSAEDGTGTRLRKAARLMDEHFLLMNCDTYWPLRIEKLLEFHNEKNPLVSTAVYSNKDNITKNNTWVDDEGYITKFDPSRTSADLNVINLAHAITSRDVVGLMPEKDFDYEKEIYPILVAKRQLAGYRSDQRHYSIGSLERLPITEKFLRDRYGTA